MSTPEEQGKETKKFSIGRSYLDAKDKAIEGKRIATYITASMLIVVFIQGMAILSILSSRQTIVKLPPTLYPTQVVLKVGNSFANDKYFEVWGLWAAMEIASYKPSNIAEQVNNVLGFFSKDARLKFEGPLRMIAENTQKNMIERRFVRRKVTTEVQKERVFGEGGETAIVTVEGTSDEILMNQRPASKNCQYKFVLKMDGGNLYAEDFFTDCYQK